MICSYVYILIRMSELASVGINKRDLTSNERVWDPSTRCQESGILKSQNAREGLEVSLKIQIAPFSADYPPVGRGNIED